MLRKTGAAAGPGEVLIQVAAAGLNNADLLQARGAYPPPPGAPRNAGHGSVRAPSRLGRRRDGVRDRATRSAPCCPAAAMPNMRWRDAGSVLPVPDAVDLVDAAACPKPPSPPGPISSIPAGCSSGETLLVHGGTSGIGSLAIQIFAARGHKVFTTAGSDEKCAACRKFGAARAINYKTEDFVAVVQAETRRRRRCDPGHGRRRLHPAQHRRGRQLGPHRQYRLSVGVEGGSRFPPRAAPAA